MTIGKATQLAMLTGCRMKRMDVPGYGEIKPTNSSEDVIAYDANGNRLAGRWTPTAADLTSDCWAVILKTPGGAVRPWEG